MELPDPGTLENRQIAVTIQALHLESRVAVCGPNLGGHRSHLSPSHTPRRGYGSGEPASLTKKTSSMIDSHLGPISISASGVLQCDLGRRLTAESVKFFL
jgi:hypothetical protein